MFNTTKNIISNYLIEESERAVYFSEGTQDSKIQEIQRFKRFKGVD